jgi:hypothetical protein
MMKKPAPRLPQYPNASDLVDWLSQWEKQLRASGNVWAALRVAAARRKVDCLLAKRTADLADRES